MRRLVFARLTVIVIACVAYVSPADAHRLDEYLQATRMAIDVDRIVLEIDLTAGASIASRVFAMVDRDGDGHVSDAEADSYARRVIDSTTLSIDGQRARVALLTREFPAFEEMAAGTGTIRLRAAALTSTSSGHHQVAYLNTHAADGSVYLVNALMPSDARVQIGAPHRDPLQRGLTLDVDVAPAVKWIRIGWLGVAATVIGTLGMARRRRRLPVARLVPLVLAVTSVSLACAARSTSAAPIPLDSRFTLAPGETTAVDGTSRWIRFDRVVEDSRCPTDVSCIQAGDAIIGITVIQKPGPTTRYQLHTATTGSRSAVDGDVTIALEDLNPRPISSRAIRPGEYRATLRASR